MLRQQKDDNICLLKIFELIYSFYEFLTMYKKTLMPIFVLVIILILSLRTSNRSILTDFTRSGILYIYVWINLLFLWVSNHIPKSKFINQFNLETLGFQEWCKLISMRDQSEMQSIKTVIWDNFGPYLRNTRWFYQMLLQTLTRFLKNNLIHAKKIKNNEHWTDWQRSRHRNRWTNNCNFFFLEGSIINDSNIKTTFMQQINLCYAVHS